MSLLVQAHNITVNSRWESDPVGLYDELIREKGEIQATKIWQLACQIADEDSGPDAPMAA